MVCKPFPLLEWLSGSRIRYLLECSLITFQFEDDMLVLYLHMAKYIFYTSIQTLESYTLL